MKPPKRTVFRVFVLSWLVFALIGTGHGDARVDQQPVAIPGATAAGCARLTTLAGGGMPNQSTVIVSAVMNPATPAGTTSRGPGAPALPEHCEVVGKMNERVGVGGQRYAINFRLRLPTEWNRRFFFQGGGGTNGAVGSALGTLQGQQPTVALAMGYAVVSQDSGHDSAVNNDPALAGPQTFGFDPQARVDFGYHSYDEVTQAAKAIIRLYYGRGPDKSYYVGCSEGGREAMMMSQRFPEYFDGILACAPGFRLPRAAVAQAFDSQVLARVAADMDLKDANGHAFLNRTLSDEDLALVSGAVASACDGMDGATDGLVQDFTSCTTAVVKPKLTALTCGGAKDERCLTLAQVNALVALFDGAKTASGEAVYAPWAWDTGIGGRQGTGYNGGWRSWKLGAYGAPQNSGLNVTLGGAALAAIFVTPPSPAPSTGGGAAAYALRFDVNGYRRALSTPSGVYREPALEFMRADDTNLSAFRRHGGKLMIVHGVSDPVFSIVDTVNWWNDVNRTSGGATDFVRLFAVPGMNHCQGGPATDRFNAFASLVDWVERGTSPDRIIATAGPATPWPGRSRPLCPYPSVARYSGQGSLEDAANFTCR